MRPGIAEMHARFPRLDLGHFGDTALTSCRKLFAPPRKSSAAIAGLPGVVKSLENLGKSLPRSMKKEKKEEKESTKAKMHPRSALNHLSGIKWPREKMAPKGKEQKERARGGGGGKNGILAHNPLSLSSTETWQLQHKWIG